MSYLQVVRPYLPAAVYDQLVETIRAEGHERFVAGYNRGKADGEAGRQLAADLAADPDHVVIRPRP